MNLGENIYKFRTGRSMSQGDLAEALEVSRQSVSKWENSSAVPELDKLMKLAAIFEISLDELVTGEERMCPKITPEHTTAPRTESHSATQRTLAIVLLSTGLAAFLVISLLYSLVAGFLAAATLYVPGLVCLLAKKRAGLKCAWAEFFMLALLFMIGSGTSWNNFWTDIRLLLLCDYPAEYFNTWRTVISLIEWIVLMGLITWTVCSFYHEVRVLKKSDLWLVGIGVLLYLSPNLLMHFEKELSYDLMWILSMACNWLRVAVGTVMLIFLAPTVGRRFRKRKKEASI